MKKKQFASVINSVQPVHKGYWDLKWHQAFLDRPLESIMFIPMLLTLTKGRRKGFPFFHQNNCKAACREWCDCLRPWQTAPISATLEYGKYQNTKSSQGLIADGKFLHH